MMRIWRGSLAARFISLLLLALALSQGTGLLISWDERGQALRVAARSEFFSRTASLALLLETTPLALQNEIIRVSGTTYTRFWTSAGEPDDAVAWESEAWMQLARPLPSRTSPDHQLADSGRPRMTAMAPVGFGFGFDAATDTPQWADLPSRAWPLSRHARFLHLGASNGMGLAVRLDNGTWLSAAYAKPIHNTPWTAQSILSLAITAIALSAIAVLVSRGIARPMRRLAAATELLGRGESVPPLPESGPDHIRQTAEAFNRMQARLQRFAEDRTRMLAAIGHDLRTPLTSLRLRAEFVADPDLQEKMLTTIEEIQTMTEAAIAFAREEATIESTRAVALSALVEGLCDDLAELGQQVAFLGGPKINYRCRPDALRRAVRNLVENAVRYGERARVSLAGTTESIDITVEDDGPGIPDEALEQVFASFFRLEHSRNRETGGVGLGLSIARTIARHHGGDIMLSNRNSGMRALISLPLPG
ncbi:two-component system sensor histidine kinase family protein [Azotobacter armeniacus]